MDNDTEALAEDMNNDTSSETRHQNDSQRTEECLCCSANSPAEVSNSLCKLQRGSSVGDGRGQDGRDALNRGLQQHLETMRRIGSRSPGTELSTGERFSG